MIEAMKQGVGRLPAQGRPRPAVRRLLPHGRLLGDGVQDRGLDRDDAGRGRLLTGAARADHARRRLGARLGGRRCHGRPVLAARAPARHRERRRHDRGQGRGADVGAPDLRAGPALDHRRAGRVHARVPPLRGGPPHLAQKIVQEHEKEEEAVKPNRPPVATLATPWRARATSAPTSWTSRATSAGGRCFVASARSPIWPVESAARCASCARSGRSTRAGFARTAATS